MIFFRFSMMLIRTEEGKADTCLCGLGEVKDCKWIQCGNGKCSSPWWHRKCANVSSYTEEEVEKMDFLCPLCIISNKKFENQLKVVVANRQLEEAEMPHTSLPTTTEVANRQQIEVERTHSSLPTSIASPSAENAANIAGSHVSAANVASPNVPETKGAGPHVSVVNKRNIQSTQSQFICSFYKKGRCRHSISGKKIYNGSQCKYLHPRKCERFCKFGSNRYNGCDGSTCKLFHPILCKYSVEYGECPLENCTFNHLMGTKRKSDYSTRSNNINLGYGHNYTAARYQNAAKVHNSRQENQKWSQSQWPTNQNQPPIFEHRDFPPLPGWQENKIIEMSTAIKDIQSCLSHLMQKKDMLANSDVQPSYIPDTNATSLRNQRNVNWSNPPYPVYGHTISNEAKNLNR